MAYPLAVLLVAGASFGAVALVVGARDWSRWVLRTGGVVGAVGLAVTAVAAANLFVPRTCSRSETAVGVLEQVNRPALSVVVDDGDCFRSGLAQVQLLALVALGTTGAAVAVATKRR